MQILQQTYFVFLRCRMEQCCEEWVFVFLHLKGSFLGKKCNQASSFALWFRRRTLNRCFFLAKVKFVSVFKELPGSVNVKNGWNLMYAEAWCYYVFMNWKQVKVLFFSIPAFVYCWTHEGIYFSTIHFLFQKVKIRD